MYIIYKAQSPSGKIYIGITSRNLEVRKREHYYEAQKTNRPFYAALNKYEDKMKWEILEKLESFEQASKKEIYYIEKFNTLHPNGYNYTIGGEGTSGYKHTTEAKYKISQSLLNRTVKKETKLKLSKKRKKYSEEKKLKMAVIQGSKSFLVIDKTTKEILKIYINKSQCSRDLNLSRRKIQDCLQGKRKSHKGYKFIYKEEYYGT